MNGKHASGRLVMKLSPVDGAAMIYVEEFASTIARAFDADDGRRLVAAWNAAGGMETATVEELAEIGGIAALIAYGNDVRRERDEARRLIAAAAVTVAKMRADLTAVGGFENDLIGVPAGGVRKMIELLDAILGAEKGG